MKGIFPGRKRMNETNEKKKPLLQQTHALKRRVQYAKVP